MAPHFKAVLDCMSWECIWEASIRLIASRVLATFCEQRSQCPLPDELPLESHNLRRVPERRLKLPIAFGSNFLFGFNRFSRSLHDAVLLSPKLSQDSVLKSTSSVDTRVVISILIAELLPRLSGTGSVSGPNIYHDCGQRIFQPPVRNPGGKTKDLTP